MHIIYWKKSWFFAQEKAFSFNTEVIFIFLLLFQPPFLLQKGDSPFAGIILKSTQLIPDDIAGLECIRKMYHMSLEITILNDKMSAIYWFVVY